MKKICEICGREHTRTSCPYCKRLQRFLDLKQYHVYQQLPPRLAEDLKKYHVPIKYIYNSLYLYGPVSSGKTLQAGALFFERCKEAYIDNKPLKAEFVMVPELLLRIRNTFQPTSMETEKEIVDYYSAVDFLVLDDLGVDKCSDWVLQTLYLIINRRYENQLQTIITSNLSLGELVSWFGGDERLVRRIKQTYIVLNKTKVYTKHRN